MTAPTIPLTASRLDAGDRLRRLTTADLAERLNRTQQTIRAWVNEDGLPAHRVKGRLQYDPVEVEAWLRARSGEPEAPAEEPESVPVDPAADVDPDWVTAQVAKFGADDLRRAGELLLALSRSAETNGGAR
ncbi:hypothetical protein A5761_03105 [Mycolicibacterium setense]|uniref:helix-turn-helix domain-containing protein n=1 Tax=Mycolicibacterium setense TaxID=431269 RepID=UPI0007EAFAAB|nr:helix-turn-helix domain-containing protein [Mycolicibacterium setense]OBB21110.1 hypothetical protein A5761_03105 [Mycolicibacterium setense]